ncbi:MAG: hypothetical protein M3336_10510 [Chloroflexota bacterium]|nr:hypothetical protein [Chloroflexota bacterium]
MVQIARVSRFEGDPLRMDEGINLVSGIGLGETSGNTGRVLLVDRSTGRAMTITFWDSEAAASGSAGVVAPLREQIAQAFGVTAAPTVETYEVAVSDFPVNQ